MKLLYKSICVALFCFLGAIGAQINKRDSLFISADHGFILTDTKQEKRNKIKEKSLVVDLQSTNMLINNKKISPRILHIEAQKGALVVNGLKYDGSITIVPKRNKLEVIINHVSKKNYFKVNTAIDISYQKIPKKKCTVRVLLDEKHKKHNEWHLFSKKGFVVFQKDKKKRVLSAKDTLNIGYKNGFVVLNNKKTNYKELFIVPKTGIATFNGNTYQGVFFITQHDNKSLCINCLDLENYVFSVLRTESWPGWPLEVNKVFAIASRSYVIAMAMRAQKTKLPYHVKNTNEHQTYSGVHDCPVIKRAVKETSGVFLAHNNVPVLAMFDSCCGGIIPAYMDNFNFTHAPYLARDYPCKHCKRCKIYSWQKEFSFYEFEKLLKKEQKILKRLKNIKITKKDKAGVVHELEVRNAGKLLKVPGKSIYYLSKDIKSFCYNIYHKSDRVIFKGRGFGHHIGLCQWGAREMVRDGWNYRRILQFYYPKTDFMKLA